MAGVPTQQRGLYHLGPFARRARDGTQGIQLRVGSGRDQREVLWLADRLDGQVDIKLWPVEVVFRWALNVGKLLNRGLLEPRKVAERHGKLFISEQEPEAVRRDIGDLSARSDGSMHLEVPGCELQPLPALAEAGCLANQCSWPSAPRACARTSPRLAGAPRGRESVSFRGNRRRAGAGLRGRCWAPCR